MKKFLSVLTVISALLALTLAVSALPTSMGERPANDGEVVFSLGDNADDMSTDQPGSTALSIVDIGDKKAFEVKRTAENGIIAIWIEPADFADISDCAWLEFWMDISEYQPDPETTFWPVFRAFDGVGACVDSFAGGDFIEYKYFQDGEWVEGSIDPYGRMGIPGGFSGYVRIALDQFLESMSSMAGNGAVFNPKYFCRFMIWTDQNELKTKDISVYYADFRFVKDSSRVVEEKEEVIEAPAPEQPQPPTNGGAVLFLNGDSTGINGVNAGVQEVSVAATNVNLIKIKTVRKGGEPGISYAGDAVNASGMKYFQFWIDTSAISTETPVAIGLRIFDNKGAVADIYGAGKDFAGEDFAVNYYLLIDGEWVEYTMDNQTPRIALPVGYSGYVRLNMEQFKECTTNYIGNGNVIDMSGLNQMWLWYAAAEEQVDRSAYVNDFKFVNEGDEADSLSTVAEDTTAGEVTTAGTEDTAADTGDAADTTAEIADTDDGKTKNGNTGLIIGIVAAVVVVAAAVAAVLVAKKKK